MVYFCIAAPGRLTRSAIKTMTTIELNGNAIEQKTRELCEALVTAPNVSAIRQRIDKFMADDSARHQYETVMSKGQVLHEKQHQSLPLSGEEISDFEKSREAMLNNPVARGFLDAQEELNGIQESIQSQVAKTLELGRLPSPDDLQGEGGSCGSGCGCHH
ncbi:MAG: YlbF family regulator [Pedosphaera sp.]|nr:YlbF family regulator [Pedosphaera sp.]